MQIDNVRVYDLKESIVASGLPMKWNYDQVVFTGAAINMPDADKNGMLTGPDFDRAKRLALNPPGTGHANFLTGVLVSANVSATVKLKWWTQFERYHHAQIVSSMSTMHRLRQMLKTGTAVFDKKTDKRITEILSELAADGADDETLAYSCPMGLILTARITTNYLQLKTMYFQRSNHKLAEWRKFCNWIESLPYSGLITERKQESKAD